MCVCVCVCVCVTVKQTIYLKGVTISLVKLTTFFVSLVIYIILKSCVIYKLFQPYWMNGCELWLLIATLILLTSVFYGGRVYAEFTTHCYLLYFCC